MLDRVPCQQETELRDPNAYVVLCAQVSAQVETQVTVVDAERPSEGHGGRDQPDLIVPAGVLSSHPLEPVGKIRSKSLAGPRECPIFVPGYSPWGCSKIWFPQVWS